MTAVWEMSVWTQNRDADVSMNKYFMLRCTFIGV
jgi:hypothetical protein